MIEIDRVAFRLFGLDVMWYGILMAAGILVASVIALKEARRVGVKEDDVLNVLIVGIPVGLICARLYYVIFNWSYYSANQSEILNFRGGGMAIHGALIGGILAGYIYTRVRKIKFTEIADVVLIGAPLAQAIGRWGNFINGEAHGGPTTLPWGILVDGQMVHPTFLYESIWNLLVFAFLMATRKKNKYNGQVVVSYITLYSVGRFFIEGLRTDSLMFGPLKMAQIVSLGCIVLGIVLHFYLSKRNKIETKK